MNKVKIEREGEEIAIFWEGKVYKKINKSLIISQINSLLFCDTFPLLEEKVLELQMKKGRELVAFWLSRRGLFRKELEEKLVRFGFPSAVVEESIVFAEKIGAIDDTSLAERLMEKELRKGRGVLFALAKIRRWVENEEIETKALLSLEKEAIQKVCEKKRIDLPVKSWPERRKIFTFLLQRGFAKQIIEEVLGR